MPSERVIRYARLICGCTLDLTRHEWEVLCAAKGPLQCPKCNAEPVHYIATWKPTEREEAWS
jgi:hypothetical protein